MLSTYQNVTNIPAKLVQPMSALEQYEIQLGLTATFTVFYSLLFAAAYFQLWLVLLLRQKLISYQTVYFFLCCLYTGLRIVLFAFFYKDAKSTAQFHYVTYWILLCLPTFLQYIIVLVITLFYFRTYERVSSSIFLFYKYKKGVIAVLVSFMFFLNLIPLISKGLNLNYKYRWIAKFLCAVQVLLSDFIFIATVAAFNFVYNQFPKQPNGLLVQEVKHVTRGRCIVVTITCMTVVTAKLVYDIVAIHYFFDKHPPFQLVLEQTDYFFLANNTYAYIIFGSLLFFWEVAPLVVVIIIFRVRFPPRFFQKKKRPLSKSQASGSKSASRSTSTNYTPSSRTPINSNFIAVPHYASVNRNSTDTSSGPFSPPLQNSYGSGRWYSPPFQYIIGHRGNQIPYPSSWAVADSRSKLLQTTNGTKVLNKAYSNNVLRKQQSQSKIEEIVN